MASQLIFLGTAGDPMVMGQQHRASGGLILRVGDVQFHIDPGPGALVRASQTGVNPRATTAVLVSHAHLNHCNDLNAVVAAMTHGGLDKHGVVFGHESCLTDEVFRPYYRACMERIIPLEAGKRAGVENIDFQALPTRHSVPGIGFKFFCPDFTLAYLSDTGFSKELAEAVLDSDILVLNVVDPSGHENEYNLTTDTALEMINLVKPSFALISHFGTKMLKADPMYEARRLQSATGVQTVAVKDGMSIDPANAAGSAVLL